MRPLPLVLLGALLLCAAPLFAQNADPLSQAEQLIQRRQPAEARRILEPLAKASPGDARTAFLLGRAFLGEDQFDAAIRSLERAVSLDGKVADHHYVLGSAYGLKAQRSNVIGQARLALKAKGALERAVALDADHLDARSALVQFHSMAPKIMGGDRAEARRQAAEIQRRDPYRGGMALGTIHLGAGDLPAAEAEFDALRRLAPDSVSPVVALVTVYDRQGRPEAAIPMLETFLRRRPDAMGALYQLGRLGAVTGQNLERSEEALRRYLRHRPEPGEPPLAAAHWRLGMVLEKQGRMDQARAEYRAALALDPKHKESREALKRIGG
jgi:tetratricopeptide (TPR) repeat protein